MRVAVTIAPRDPRRDLARDDAEWWLRHHGCARWPARGDEDDDGREVLAFEFMDPLDGMDFQHRTAPAGRRGRPL